MAPRPAAGAPPADPLTGGQWHLDAIDVAPVWADYTGAGVLVAVIDDGVQGDHPDLRANYDPTLAFDHESGAADGAPVYAADRHGTAVAGLIAAASNGIGGTGVAFGAHVTSYRALFPATRSSHEAAALGNAHLADVANNSWGYTGPGALFVDDFLGSAAFRRVGSALERAVRDGRDGLGTVIVFAAGNGRQGGDDVNYHNLLNSRFTVVAAASDRDGVVADYSGPGAALLVTAPGGYGDIVTTDRTGAAGYARGDATLTFGGTSAATPIVSGVVALMLEANPRLGYRDVQEILAYSARLTGDPAAYQTNGARNWNGGGLHVSHDYGFGLVDARAAVRLAETWTAPRSTLANEVSHTAAEEFPGGGRSIPDGDGALRVALTPPAALRLDHVEAVLRIEHGRVGDLVVTLISPDGTRSVLVDRPPEGPGGGRAVSEAFAFGSTRHWGETGAGAWTLEVRDVVPTVQGVLRDWSLTLYGDGPSGDDTYVYTDAYAAHAGEPGRATLRDAGGQDVLNAAALTEGAAIDLRPGATSTVAGAPLTIAPGTVIESAHGGDGHDLIRGGSRGNVLHGMRGDDRLFGGGGTDVLRGGEGDDVLYGQDGGDRLFGGAGRDALVGNAGHDRLAGGPGDDALRAGFGDDVLSGEAGHDRLAGEGGSDRLLGGPGDDLLWGGPGDDALVGGPGDDRLFGGAGADVLAGGSGADRLFGGPGPDVFRFVALGHGVDRIPDFGAGDALDLGELLAGTGAAGDPARFVDLLDRGADATVRVGPGGRGFVPLACLEGLAGIDRGDILIDVGGPAA
ncbi:MAG TPA: S8 family serine peptidase [Geminicoccaceae bacterium]|nr:S8 family serine peptidase [Geminicoccaceae bacterium]